MRKLILSVLALAILNYPTAPTAPEGGECVVTVLPGIGATVKGDHGYVHIFNASTQTVMVSVRTK